MASSSLSSQCSILFLGECIALFWGNVIKYCIMTVACISNDVIAIIHLHKDGQTLAVPQWLDESFLWVEAGYGMEEYNSRSK